MNLRARDAEQVDASDTIVMPGFVDSHRHVWTSLFRNLGDGDPRTAVRAPAWVVGDHYGAEDVYAATLVGLLGAAAAGSGPSTSTHRAPAAPPRTSPRRSRPLRPPPARERPSPSAPSFQAPA